MTDEEKATVGSMVNVEEAVIREELDFEMDKLVANVERVLPDFTDEQREIYDTVMTAVRDNRSLQLFISARGGCGKTYLLNTLLDSTRSLERGVVLLLPQHLQVLLPRSSTLAGRSTLGSRLTSIQQKKTHYPLQLRVLWPS